MEGSHGRVRGGSWRRGGGHDDDNAGGEHRGRGGRGGNRGRSKRDHYRGRGRAGHAAASFPHRNQNEEMGQTLGWEEEEEGARPVFSRRKLDSNWDRYLESEREEPADDTPAVRGTDYHVLLESAGDSFTQFRFSEEKDWETDSVASSQMSAVRLDLVVLAQCLQALPLHQRLNLEAELVQVSTPLELPSAPAAPPKQEPVLFRPPVAGPRLPSAGDPPIAASPQETRLSADLSVVDGDDELDRLLGLDEPGPDNDDTSQPAEAKDTHVVSQEVTEAVTVEAVTVEAEPVLPTRTESTKQEVTEEDLEDWLDSMIS